MNNFTDEMIDSYADKLLIGLTDEEAARTVRITIPDDVDETLIENIIYEIKKQIALMIC